MGRLFALLYDPVMHRTEAACLQDHRRELLADLAGDVLEIGAGTGANLALYPETVTRLVLSEPDDHMRARLERALAAVPPRAARAETSSASADALPFAADSFDAVVCTLVLCTVPDPAKTLSEIRRVLRPGGTLRFLEHVAAEDDPERLRWQERVEPVWRCLAEGCHTTRRTGRAIREAGFAVEREAKGSMRKSLPWVRPLVWGVARKAAT